MKAACFAIVAVIYVLPMLIVSSYGNDNSSNHQLLNLIGLNYTLSLKQPSENDTLYYGGNQIDEKVYQWIDYKSELASEEKLVFADDKKEWAVSRASYENGHKIPCVGMFDLEQKRMHNMCADLSDGNRTVLEVLQIEPSHIAKWVGSSNGQIIDGAIEGGNIRGETIYLCRTHYDEEILTGMVRPSNRSCVVQGLSQNKYDSLVLSVSESVIVA